MHARVNWGIGIMLLKLLAIADGFVAQAKEVGEEFAVLLREGFERFIGDSVRAKNFTVALVLAHGRHGLPGVVGRRALCAAVDGVRDEGIVDEVEEVRRGLERTPDPGRAPEEPVGKRRDTRLPQPRVLGEGEGKNRTPRVLLDAHTLISILLQHLRNPLRHLVTLVDEDVQEA